MEAKDACIPIDARPMNEVDELRKRIAEIQGSCEHDFRLTERPQLEESKVKGVYIVYDASCHQRSEVAMMLRCLRCSKEKTVYCSHICPDCLGGMQDSWLKLRQRKEYFGKSHIYYSVRLKSCESCGFTVVMDEWNR